MTREKKEKQQMTKESSQLDQASETTPIGNDTPVIGEILAIKENPELDIRKFQPDTRVGAITGKIQLHEQLKYFHSSLAAIGLVHRRGARKYTPYGWFCDPFNTDATPTATLSALLRHFSAHSMGFFTDIEGLPHIFHMCCRAAMYVSIKYKWRFGAVLRWNHGLLTPSAFNPDTDENEVALNWQHWITPMELVSLSKFTPDHYRTFWEDELTMHVHKDSNQFSYDKLRSAVWTSYMSEAIVNDDQSATIAPLTANDVFHEVYPEDMLFHLTLLFTEKWLSMVNLSKSVLMDKLTAADKELLEIIEASADQKSIL